MSAQAIRPSGWKAAGTAGLGFFLLPIYWIAVMMNVWVIPDRVVTAPEDEGEQY